MNQLYCHKIDTGKFCIVDEYFDDRHLHIWIMRSIKSFFF